MRALAIAVSLFCALLIVPGSVLAQGKPSTEIAGGYSFIRDYHVQQNFPAAWFASSAYNITSWLAAVGEVGGTYKSYTYTVNQSTYNVTVPSANWSTSTRLHTLLAGPRWRLMGGAAFAQVLTGAAWESGGVTVFRQSIVGDRKLALQPGGGIDLPLTNRLSARVGVDYRRIFAKRKNVVQKNNNELRVGAGLVVGFGNK